MLDYSSPEVQDDLLDLLARLENTTYIDPTYTESWLRDDVPSFYPLYKIYKKRDFNATHNCSVNTNGATYCGV